jgi:sucrose-6-phosphate hydrolase SacC (GH32 family)
MGGQALVEPKDGLLQFEILLDRSSIEIFANDGEVVLSSCFTPVEEDDELTLWTQGGELFVNEIQVYELKSAWNGK